MSVSENAGAGLLQRVERDLQRGTSDLPQLPRGAAEALRLARSTEFDVDAAATLAENDPPLAARVLAVANSVLYARGARHVSPRRAVAHIGAAALREVLYQTAYASMIVDVPRFAKAVANDFVHSVATAALARALARVAPADPDEAFLAGLLHDLGRARCWSLVAKRLPSTGADDAEALAVVDALHAAAGHALVLKWQLPDAVAEVCLHHHESGERKLPRIVAAADILIHAADGTPDLRSPVAALEAIGIDGNLTGEWIERGAKEFERARLMTKG